jgi:LPS export ABC transporter protein LptC
MFRIFATCLFIAIIAGSIWLGSQQSTATPTTPVESATTDLGYSARKATLIETGPDGVPMYTLNADVIREHPNSDVDFDHVQMAFRDDNGQTWTAHAIHGELGQDTSEVELTGDVHVDGILPGSPDNTDLATEALSVDRRTEVISTSEPVTVSSPGRVLNALGLQASLKDRHLILESNIHGTFTP